MKTLLHALAAVLANGWEPQWSINSIEEVPKYGDIRDTWTVEIDPNSKQAVYSTLEVFGRDRYISGFYFSLRTKSEMAVLADVKIGDLWPTQDSVFVGGLDRKVKSPDLEPPLVVKWKDGRLMLTNHTRVAAAIVRGDTRVSALVVGVDEGGKPRKLSEEEIAELA